MTTANLTIQGLDLSTSLWKVATGLNQVHSIWKIYVKGTTYIQPDNWMGLIAGHTFEFLFRDNIFVKLPTVPFFVIARFLKLFETEDELVKSYKKFVREVKLISLVEAGWMIPQKVPLNGFFSLYTIQWVKINTDILWVRIQRIAFSSLNLAWQTFQLVMRMMDIVELITLDPNRLSAIVTDSAREIVLNIQCLKKVTKNKQAFVERLNSKKEGVGFALQMLGAERMKSKDLLVLAEQLIENADTAIQFLDKKGALVGKALSTIVEKLIYDAAPVSIQQMMKEHHLKPNTDWLKDKTRCVKAVRFPPKELITYAPPVKESIANDQNGSSFFDVLKAATKKIVEKVQSFHI